MPSVPASMARRMDVLDMACVVARRSCPWAVSTAAAMIARSRLASCGTVPAVPPPLATILIASAPAARFRRASSAASAASPTSPPNNRMCPPRAVTGGPARSRRGSGRPASGVQASRSACAPRSRTVVTPAARCARRFACASPKRVVASSRAAGSYAVPSPGMVRWTWESISPGVMVAPGYRSTRIPRVPCSVSASSSPTSAMLPSSMRMAGVRSGAGASPSKSRSAVMIIAWTPGPWRGCP